jgi:hypothetical protein
MILGINDTQHNIKHAECPVVFVVMQSVIVLSVVMLNVVAPSYYE